MKNHEKENHNCKTLNVNKDYHVKECSFQKEKLEKLAKEKELTKLVEIYKINDNASVGDSSFNLEEVKGKPKYKEGNFKRFFRKLAGKITEVEDPPFVWDKLPLYDGKDGRKPKPKSLGTSGIRPIIFLAIFVLFIALFWGFFST